MQRVVRAFCDEVASTVRTHAHELPLRFRYHNDAIMGRLTSRFTELAAQARGTAVDFGRRAVTTGTRLVEWSHTEAVRTMGALALHGREVAVGFAEDFGKRAAVSATELMLHALDRTEDVIDQAAAIGEALEWDTFTGMIDEAMDGVVGRAINSARTAIGSAHAELTQDFQEAAGVRQYVWVVVSGGMGDERVRYEHMALNFQTCSWDDPPLKADVSSNGEDDHPGEDWGCRCGAAPVLPEEKAQEEGDEE